MIRRLFTGFGGPAEVRELLAWNTDPEMLFRRIRQLPGAIFFDSSGNVGALGKYSILLFDPFAELTVTGNRVRFKRHAPFDSGISGANRKIPRFPFDREDFEIDSDPFDVMRAMLDFFRVPESDPPRHTDRGNGAVSSARQTFPCENGCAAGYFSYDLGFSIERIRERAEKDIDIPTVTLGLYDTAVVTDHSEQAAYLCIADCPNGRTGASDPDRIAGIRSRFLPTDGEPEAETVDFECGLMESGFSAGDYCAAVSKAREYIRDGDIYQVNLSQRFEGRFSGDPYHAYRTLRKKCPAPFSAYMSFGPLQILSNSPERFFEIDGRVIRTRPIKGTRPRGKSPDEDNALRLDLEESEKDRAELTMIVDLLRNDLGRVCRLGSVRVEKLFETESYANVFHRVATIRGECAEGLNAADILRGVFPGGSITGTPKIRAMEIIEELEPVKRGIYTGSLGYIGFDGRSDLNIAIRTLVCYSNRLYYQVGGGIVWDSDPMDEYEETMHKGRSIRETLLGFRNEPPGRF